jgi:hypothetical protein
VARALDVHEQPTAEADALGGAPRYPLIEVMRSHGRRVAVGAAVATFAVVAADRGLRPARRTFAASAAAAAVGVALAYVHEMTVVVAETLLPE